MIPGIVANSGIRSGETDDNQFFPPLRRPRQVAGELHRITRALLSVNEQGLVRNRAAIPLRLGH